MYRVAFLAVLVTPLLWTPLPGQSSFRELALLHLPRTDDNSNAVAVADVDGDGDLDLTIGNNNTQNRLYLNRGDAVFTDVTATHLPVASYGTRALAFGDVDGDRDQDLVIGNEQASSRLWINDGSGHFTEAPAARFPTDSPPLAGHALADLDGDGDLDYVSFGTFAGRMFRNDGTGTFVNVTGTNLPPAAFLITAVTVTDLEGDGKPDLVLACSGGTQRNRIWQNQGNGVFLDATAGRMPSGPTNSTAVVAGDVDGDSDVDLVFANQDAPLELYVNDGNGSFTRDPARMPSERNTSRALLLADVDRDADLDLVVGNQSLEQRLRIYRNDGQGRFATSPGLLPWIECEAAGLAAGDLDRDGDVDLMVANLPLRQATRPPGGQDRVLLNDGRGRFADGSREPWPLDGDTFQSMAFADLDGDGDRDALVARASSNRPIFRRFDNDGGWFFEQASGLPPSFGRRHRALRFGDLDRDGDLDLLVANEGPERFYRNDGGQWVDMSVNVPPVNDVTNDLVLVDIDGDGDLDFMTANGESVLNPEQERLYRNDGHAVFTDVTATHLPADQVRTMRVVVADFDGDLDSDLLLASIDSAFPEDRLWLNDGSGHFSVASGRLPPTSTSGTSIHVTADVDRDGDVDLFRTTSTGINQLLINDGRGYFADESVARLPFDRFNIVPLVADVDEDGDDDVILRRPQQAILWINDGAGRFADATAGNMPHIPDFSSDVGLAEDVDQDGDVDVLLAGSGVDALLFNMRRQLTASLLPRVGGELRLVISARPGQARSSKPALPMVALGRASIPVPPYGVFGLDVAAMVVLPPVSIPAPAGELEIVVPLQVDRALVGLTLYAQAIVVDPEGRDHLTGTIALPIQ